MRVWVSKYALRNGITEHEVPMENIGAEYLTPGSSIGSTVSINATLKIGRDAHFEREAAVDAANTLRVRKIAELRKQIAELERTVF